MTARTPSRVRRVVLPLVALVGIVAAAGVTVVALRLTDGEDCTGTLSLKVAVAPGAEGVVRGAAEDYQADQPVVEHRCVQVQVEARSAPDVANELPTAQINPPALWIPDSTMWAEQTKRQAGEHGADAPTLELGPSLATSPLVVAGSAKAVGALGDSVSWAGLIDPKARATLTDPTTSTEGLAALAIVRGLLGNPDGTPKPELIGALMRVGRNALPSVRDAFTKITQGSGDDAPVFATTEQSVLDANRVAGSRKVVAAYPKEGTLAFDYPVVRVGRAGEPAGTAQAAEDFERHLRTGRTLQRFAEAGFRTTDGKAPQGWKTDREGVRGEDVSLLTRPDADQVAELLRTWGAVSLDTRMLTLLDVSGSMAEPMEGSRETRIGAARDAALTALAMLPDTSEVGLWAFGRNKRPPDDWIELISTGPLGETVAGTTRRARLQTSAGGLATLVGGGTALNDTVLAAYREARRTFDPMKINSVALITDGSDDDISSIDLPTLLSTLREEADPARPVPMFLVGLGADADLDALRQIAEATGGKAYQALKGEDIRTVLLDAISQRRCRPNC
ncbi:substrate-binding and VWA domain-containing protein [Saccharothrix violaceirubra]|uniref:VWFA domain-containing protein n=1 Tax=Saccharothrix violaceirubra TaxID=413306 RepID=A0A7W7T997_9PSEU|nr:substrate-binding and VWA domain-containing protein [Saccharothrix violaceirubra]MBB4968889.1 hypothetical protein [Saccharothrix violaceirubra]